METATEEVSLYELLRLALADDRRDLHVALPARVESYDADAQTVQVTPLLKRAMPDGAGNYVVESITALADVPVAFPRCKKFEMSFPLEKGDTVLLVFSERSIANWRATGNVSDPGDLGMHTLDGAVAIPGLYDDANPAKAATSDSMVLGSSSSGNGRIELKASQVLLGGGAQFVALANLVKTQLDAIATAYNTHTHTAGTPSTGTPSATYTSAAVAASNVKAT